MPWVAIWVMTLAVMFAIPIVGMRDMEPRPPVWLRLAAASGFAVTALYVVLSVFPIIEVTSWTSFALKISSVVILLNLIGAGLYVNATVRRRRAGVAPGSA